MIETIHAPKNKLASLAMLVIDPIRPGKQQPVNADTNSNVKYQQTVWDCLEMHGIFCP